MEAEEKVRLNDTRQCLIDTCKSLLGAGYSKEEIAKALADLVIDPKLYTER